MAEIKVGDTVKVSFEGTVEWTNDTAVDINLPGLGTRSVFAQDCTVIHPPTQVGDIVTPENVHLLPEGFVVVDRDGAPWNDEPHAATLREYGPFKLVYIHQPSGS